MPAPICSNIHRINEVTNNRQQLVVEGFSFYAVAEISTTMRKPLSAFMEASEIKVRQCVYIDKETHDKYANIIRYMGNGITLGRYIDNVLNEHLRQYQNELQEAYYQSIQNAKLF